MPNDKIYDEALSTKFKVKLVDLIRKYNASVVLLSTTGHPAFGEILTFPCTEDLGYDLFEVTSAGLNSNPGTDLYMMNKLIVPEIFNNFTDRVFQPNFGRIEVNWNVNKNKSSISLELANQKGERLITITKEYEDFIVKNRTGLNMRTCTTQLYGSIDNSKAILLNVLQRLFEPDMLPVLLGVVATILISMGCCCMCCCWASNLRNRLNQSMIGEYEHFHRD